MKRLNTQIQTLGTFVSAMWLVEIVDTVIYRGRLDRFGVIPRDPESLWGILWMPFLHGNFTHLISNTVPFVILGWLVMSYGLNTFYSTSIFAMVVGGAGVWLFGSAGVHIGASGVIFGYLGFLLARGLFERSAQSILLSMLVLFFYGGLIFGVLPGQPGVSWEGHLFGFIGGVLAAKQLPARAVRKTNF